VSTISEWREVSFGAFGEVGYVWSARELIELPADSGTRPRLVEFDEDLMFVFRLVDGWVAVCETSVIRLVGSRETGRVELADVVDSVGWEGGELIVRDVRSGVTRLEVDGERLRTRPERNP
jgi:hypothetical protein